jgi:hypothetical protein
MCIKSWISVHVGRTCTKETSEGCNYLLEALPSVDTFGSDFIYVKPLPNETALDTTLLFVSSQNDTQITINKDVKVDLTNGAKSSFGNYTTNQPSLSIHSTHPIDIDVIDSYPSSGKQTLLSLVPNGQFNFAAQIQARPFISPSSFVNQTLIVIAKTEELGDRMTIDYMVNGTFNEISVDPTSFKAVTANPAYSFSTFQLNATNYRVTAGFTFVGYFYSSNAFGSPYATPPNRGIAV